MGGVWIGGLRCWQDNDLSQKERATRGQGTIGGRPNQLAARRNGMPMGCRYGRAAFTAEFRLPSLPPKTGTCKTHPSSRRTAAPPRPRSRTRALPWLEFTSRAPRIAYILEGTRYRCQLSSPVGGREDVVSCSTSLIWEEVGHACSTCSSSVRQLSRLFERDLQVFSFRSKCPCKEFWSSDNATQQTHSCPLFRRLAKKMDW